MKKIALAVWNWLLTQVGAIAKVLEKPAEIAIKVVNVFRDYISDPLVDVFTALTKSGIDNSIVSKLRQFLPSVLKYMLVGENIIKDATSGNLGDLLLKLGKYVATLAEGNRGKWWAELAVLVLNIIHGKDVPKPIGLSVTQGVYLRGIAGAPAA